MVGTACLMDMGFPLEVMRMFWNYSMAMLHHTECAKSYGKAPLLCVQYHKKVKETRMV